MTVAVVGAVVLTRRTAGAPIDLDEFPEGTAIDAWAEANGVDPASIDDDPVDPDPAGDAPVGVDPGADTGADADSTDSGSVGDEPDSGPEDDLEAAR